MIIPAVYYLYAELRRCVKVQVAVLGTLSLIVRTISVDAKQYLKKKNLYPPHFRRDFTLICFSSNIHTIYRLHSVNNNYIWIWHSFLQGERTKVEEVVSPKFVREELPSLEVCDLDGVTCWSRTEEGSPRLDQQDGMFVHVSLKLIVLMKSPD